MNQFIEPAGQRSASTSSQPIAPHPPLRQYYDDMEARQGFLNDLFNRTAYQYRNIDMATGFGSGLWYRRKALQQAGLKPSMQVLDVACGPGLVTQCALDLVGSSGSVIGLDPSIGMLREAQRGPSRNLVRGVGERLPFPDQSFDFLSMGYALRHVRLSNTVVSSSRAASYCCWRSHDPDLRRSVRSRAFTSRQFSERYFQPPQEIATCRRSWATGGIPPSTACRPKLL